MIENSWFESEMKKRKLMHKNCQTFCLFAFIMIDRQKNEKIVILEVTFLPKAATTKNDNTLSAYLKIVRK